MNEQQRYYIGQASYWEVISETATGFALEQAQQQRRRYLGLLGMLLTEIKYVDSDEEQ